MCPMAMSTACCESPIAGPRAGTNISGSTAARPDCPSHADVVESEPMNTGTGSRLEAQQQADRLRIFREELRELERQQVLQLTPDQRARFDAWSAARLSELASHYDVDTSVSQKRVSWGMRIVSTLGGLAICAAVALFFTRFWGYLGTPAQVAVVIFAPLAALAGTEYAARR